MERVPSPEDPLMGVTWRWKKELREYEAMKRRAAQLSDAEVQRVAKKALAAMVTRVRDVAVHVEGLGPWFARPMRSDAHTHSLSAP